MKLSLNEVAYVAQLMEEKSPISLFTTLEATLDGTEADSLRAKGFLKGDKLDGPAAEVFEVVAKGTGAARVAIQDDMLFVEKYVYRKGDKYVQVNNDMGDLAFTPLWGFDPIMISLSEFVGMGELKAAEVDVEASPEVMLVLLSLVDAYRKNNLIFQGGGGELLDEYDEKTVADGLKSSLDNSFVRIISENYGYQVPKKADVKKLLADLKEKGIVEGEYALNQEYTNMARGMLVPKAVVVLELFYADEEGNVTVDSGLAILAGLKDAIYLALGDGIMHLMTLSGKELLQVIEGYLRCPEI